MTTMSTALEALKDGDQRRETFELLQEPRFGVVGPSSFFFFFSFVFCFQHFLFFQCLVTCLVEKKIHGVVLMRGLTTFTTIRIMCEL